ncbi:MAG: hypothetical protein V2I33_24805, partial [Kangiellaceae bacterium]|nr:hypothetical protein [Kangiellaceae bacterium]
VLVSGSQGTTIIRTDDFGPTAQDDLLSGLNSGPITGNLFADNGQGEDTDPDGDDLTLINITLDGTTYTVPDAPIVFSDGSALDFDADGNVSFTPGSDFDGLTSSEVETLAFDYTVGDGNGGEDVATATIGVEGEEEDSGGGVDPSIGRRDVFFGTEEQEDIFVFGDGDSDQIRNLGPEDKIDLRDWGVQSFEELSLFDRGALLTIKDIVSGNQGYAFDRSDSDPNAEDLTPDNFIFAPVSSLTVVDDTSVSQVLRGRAGDDTIQTGAGYNEVFGMGGADIFEIGTGGNTILRDYTDGVDKIDVTAWGVTSFGELAFETRGTEIRITANGERLRIDTNAPGVSLGDIDASDFVGF